VRISRSELFCGIESSKVLFNRLKHALVLACGNPLRGDDAVALHVAKALVTGFCDGETEVHSQHQWLPEMAETISEANWVIFVDASTEIPAGAVRNRLTVPSVPSQHALSHTMNPEKLLAMTRDLYGTLPPEAFLVSIGGESFELSNQLSERVRHAVPLALDVVKAILSGVSVPQPLASSQKAAS
jgi:hydrogenase maturation protease